MTRRPRHTQAANERHSKAARNELNVLELIHASGKISRTDLARQTNSSLALLTAISHNLMSKRLIVESGQSLAHFGRKPILLSIRNDLAQFVGVDLGTFFLRAVLTDINGNILHSVQVETELSQGRDRVIKRAFSLIHKMISDSGLARGAIRGIGIGHSGVIDSEKGAVLLVPRPGQLLEWKNVPLKRMAEDEFGLPCVLEDSVRAIATAEKYFGLGKMSDDFVYIDGGMGFGSAIFIGGRLYQGAGGGAGEFGHLTVDDHGPLCCCGNRGCLEAVASCAAIIEAAKDAIAKGVNSRVPDLAKGSPHRISIENIGQAAMDNDSLAFRVLQDSISHIAVALAAVVNLLNPKLVVLGGALFRSAPKLLLEGLERSVRQRAMEKSANDVTLRISPLGSEAGALGASRLISKVVLRDLYSES